MEIRAKMRKMKKFRLTYDWPIEKGRYLAGNPLSPVAVAVILVTPHDKISEEIEELVRAGVEKGAAISGTLQTANIGIEKLIVNLISNPNIRYLILVGSESGHFTADAIKALFRNGTDDKGYIISTRAPTAILKNIPKEAVERLRKQIQLVDLSGIAGIDVLEKAVWSCYQENETSFEIEGRKYLLRDTGPFPENPIIYRLTDKLREKQDG